MDVNIMVFIQIEVRMYYYWDCIVALTTTCVRKRWAEFILCYFSKQITCNNFKPLNYVELN